MNQRSPNRRQNPKTPDFHTPGKSRNSAIKNSPRSIDKKKRDLASQLEIMIKMNADLKAKN